MTLLGMLLPEAPDVGEQFISFLLWWFVSFGRRLQYSTFLLLLMSYSIENFRPQTHSSALMPRCIGLFTARMRFRTATPLVTKKAAARSPWACSVLTRWECPNRTTVFLLFTRSSFLRNDRHVHEMDRRIQISGKDFVLSIMSNSTCSEMMWTFLYLRIHRPTEIGKLVLLRTVRIIIA